LRTGVSTREESFGLKHMLKAEQRSLPADHDPGDRAAALRYTREAEVLTTGVLYEVEGLALAFSLSEHVSSLGCR